MAGIAKERRRYLGRKGNLNCVTCGQTDLIINHREDPDIPKYRRATIDHIVPLKYWNGSPLSKINWQIMCERCNQLKGCK